MNFPWISSIVVTVKGTTILLAFLSFSFYYFSYSFPYRTKRKENNPVGRPPTGYFYAQMQLTTKKTITLCIFR